jgi:hypothetical protein
MPLLIDTHELDELTELFRRRATQMVPDAVQEGSRRAESYAAAGGRKRPAASRRYHATGRRVRRVHSATGPQKASMIERVMYHRLLDFWGNW